VSAYNPKKIAISGLVAVAFVLYSVLVRQSDKPADIRSKTPVASSSPSQTKKSSATQPPATYKDGKYVGSVADAFYGNIQIQVTIQGGKITAVDFLQYPNDQPNSVAINQQAIPYLQQETIKAQNAQVDSISGATDTSRAFVESLTSALNKAT
jgi:uncharacterized protein with FMN-binding domain